MYICMQSSNGSYCWSRVSYSIYIAYGKDIIILIIEINGKVNSNVETLSTIIVDTYISIHLTNRLHFSVRV